MKIYNITLIILYMPNYPIKKYNPTTDDYDIVHIAMSIPQVVTYFKSENIKRANSYKKKVKSISKDSITRPAGSFAAVERILR